MEVCHAVCASHLASWLVHDIVAIMVGIVPIFVDVDWDDFDVVSVCHLTLIHFFLKIFTETLVAMMG
jgi:hypothetical protein